MPKDFAVLNQLSFDHTQSKFAFIAQLNEIARLFKSASLFGIFRLRTNAEFRYERLRCGLQVDAAIMSLNDTERGLLLSILDTPYTKDDLSEDETSEIVSLSIESLNQCKALSHEIACSYVLKCLTVSLTSSETWNTHEVAVTANHDKYGKINVNVPHATCGGHLTKNWRFLIERSDFSQPPTLENPLPNRKLTEFLVGVDWNVFRDRLASLSPQEKTAELSTVSEMIASANGYTYDDTVSSANRTENHLRKIFRFERGSILVFISVDFETPAGAFEVCDRNGIHFGEVLFSGRWNKDADTGGRHNIRV